MKAEVSEVSGEVLRQHNRQRMLPEKYGCGRWNGENAAAAGAGAMHFEGVLTATEPCGDRRCCWAISALRRQEARREDKGGEDWDRGLAAAEDSGRGLLLSFAEG